MSKLQNVGRKNYNINIYHTQIILIKMYITCGEVNKWREYNWPIINIKLLYLGLCKSNCGLGH